VDLIKLGIITNEYDACILIPGDTDFIPALNLIKKNKDILVVMTPFGFSSELRKNFPYFILRESNLRECLKDFKETKR